MGHSLVRPLSMKFDIQFYFQVVTQKLVARKHSIYPDFVRLIHQNYVDAVGAKLDLIFFQMCGQISHKPPNFSVLYD